MTQLHEISDVKVPFPVPGHTVHARCTGNLPHLGKGDRPHALNGSVLLHLCQTNGGGQRKS